LKNANQLNSRIQTGWTVPYQSPDVKLFFIVSPPMLTWIFQIAIDKGSSMEDTALARIERKLDKVATAQSNLQLSVVEQHAVWGQSWPAAIKSIDANSTKIAENSTKIATVEVELAKIKTIVFVWGSVLSIVVVVSIPFITYFLEK